MNAEPMGDLHDILEAELGKLPRKLLKVQIKEKMKRLGHNSPRLVSALCDHLLTNDGSEFGWGGADLPADLVLEFTEEDSSAIEIALRKMTDVVPEILNKTLHPAAASLLRTLKKDWPEQLAWQRATSAAFEERLEERWGKALRPLRMILTIVREYAAELQAEDQPQDRSTTREVLFQLHMRGCQVLSEIVALLQGGFADGAMARWRTLHEISTVALVIAEAGDATAQRYLDHEIVETYKQLLELQQYHVELGYEPPTPEQVAGVEAAYQAKLKRHGPEFRHPYGWAAKYLGLKKPAFIHLEDAAGRAHSRPCFQMASWNVHATPRALAFRLGLFGGRGPLAGASNAGLSDPALNAAKTMVLLTSLLMRSPPHVDDLLAMKVLLLLRDEMPAQLHRAESKLKGDEDRFQAKEKKAG